MRKKLGMCMVMLMIFVLCLTAWDKSSATPDGEKGSIGFATDDGKEFFEFHLTDERGGNLRMLRMNGKRIQVTGMLDTSRRYFEGRVSWEGEAAYIVETYTGEVVLLEEKKISWLMGDYFVSCRCIEEKKEAKLLVFYCPASVQNENPNNRWELQGGVIWCLGF